MAINYAQIWQQNLVEILVGDSYCSPFIQPNVKWLGAKTFHFSQLATSGYKSHKRSGGWNEGTYDTNDVPFTVQHDRDIEFLVDKADVDETNEMLSIQNITSTFTRTQQVPEMDAQFFSAIAKKALSIDGYHSSTKASAITPETVLPYLKRIFRNKGLKRYKAKGILISYVSSDVMTALELCKDFTKVINVVSISGINGSIETKITNLDGVTLIEVTDEDRFKTEFNFEEGFIPTESAKDINVLVCSIATAMVVPKIASIYTFKPGEHTKGDGYLYQNRALWDTFVMPNGLDNKIDSVYVDTLDTISMFNSLDEVEIDYSSMTLEELKVIAKEKGIEGISKLNKSEILEKLG